MRKTKLIAFVLSAVFPAATSPAWSQVPTGIIVGQIVDSATQKPVKNASVLLDGTPYGAMSDSSGAFRLVDRFAGRFRLLKVQAINYGRRAVTLPDGGRQDSVVVGRIALAAQPISLWIDRVPECHELLTEPSALRKDSILEWIQEIPTRNGGVARRLCRVQIGK